MNENTLVYRVTCGRVPVVIRWLPVSRKVIVEDADPQFAAFRQYRLMWYMADEDALRVNRWRGDMPELIAALLEDCEEWPEWLWDFRAALVRDLI